MTKSELIRSVAASKNISRARSEALVNAIFETMKDALGRDERIEVRGLGIFEIRHYGAYTGRNPREGVQVQVKPKRLPHFKSGGELHERLNSVVTQTQEFEAFCDAPKRQLPAVRTATR